MLRKLLTYYSSADGASTGHTSAQAPQSTHLSASITYLPSFSEIASAGHSLSQLPQAMHSSALILYAIVKSSCYNNIVACILYHTVINKSYHNYELLYNILYICDIIRHCPLRRCYCADYYADAVNDCDSDGANGGDPV